MTIASGLRPSMETTTTWRLTLSAGNSCADGALADLMYLALHPEAANAATSNVALTHAGERDLGIREWRDEFIEMFENTVSRR